jgi:hypothetical protein
MRYIWCIGAPESQVASWSWAPRKPDSLALGEIGVWNLYLSFYCRHTRAAAKGLHLWELWITQCEST